MIDRVAEPVGRYSAPFRLLLPLRLVMAPALLLLAFLALPRAYAVVLAVSLVIDVAGGASRWHGQGSGWRARLAASTDLATYTSLPLCAWWLRPDLVQADAVTFWALVAAFAVPVAFHFIKYGELTAAPARAASIAAHVVAGAAAILFGLGPIWPLYIAAALLVAAALEQVAITALLPRPIGEARSLPMALRIRRESFLDADD